MSSTGSLHTFQEVGILSELLHLCSCDQNLIKHLKCFFPVSEISNRVYIVLESTVSVFTIKQNIIAPGIWLTGSREWIQTKDEIEPKRHVPVIHFFQPSQLLITFQKAPSTGSKSLIHETLRTWGSPVLLICQLQPMRCVLLPLSFNLQSTFLIFSPRLLGFGQVCLLFSFDSRLHDVSYPCLWFKEIPSKLKLGEFPAGSIHAVEIPHKPLH